MREAYSTLSKAQQRLLDTMREHNYRLVYYVCWWYFLTEDGTKRPGDIRQATINALLTKKLLTQVKTERFDKVLKLTQ